MRYLKAMIIMVLLPFFLIACGGGGGGDTVVPDDSGDNGKNDPIIVSGVAAAGAPIVGIINIKGANEATASSPIGLDGSYSIDVSALTAPYILWAEGSVNGKSISIYSAAVAAGTINVTPITDFILRNALGGHAEAAYDDWTAAQSDLSGLDAAEEEVRSQLAPLLSGAGLAAETDLISTVFDTDHTGMDAVLDVLDISYSDTTATITNNLTGSSYVDDITIANDGTGLPATDEETSTAALTDRPAIDLVFQSLVELYANDRPSDTELTPWFNANVAEDYLEWGANKDQTLDDWLYDDGGPDVGFNFSIAILEPIDVAGTAYIKGFRIRIYYTIFEYSGNFASSMVFDGTNWLWYGNRRWVDNEGPEPEALKYVHSNGQTWFQTGFDMHMGDDYNYAYNQGVRSAVVTGPGLPDTGVVLEHKFPVTEIAIYGTEGLFTVDDAILSAIPDNAQYVSRLCPEPAADLYNGTAACTALHTFTTINRKPPVPSSELDSSLFAALTNPVSHSVADLNFGGEINIGWTKPAGTRDDAISLFWWSASENYELRADLDSVSNSSVVLDATGLPAPDDVARLFVNTTDEHDREFHLGWEFR